MAVAPKTKVRNIKSILHEGLPLSVGTEFEVETREVAYLVGSGKVLPSSEYEAWAKKNAPNARKN